MYAALVPPAFQALSRAAHLLNIIEDSGRTEALLSARLHADMMDCRSQFEILTGMALRVCLPPLGREVPEQTGAVRDCINGAVETLSDLRPADFDGIEGNRVSHRAGFADLNQTVQEYAMSFALPNMWFHLSMVYAILRAEGVVLTKGDFDGIHMYPAGFSLEP